MKIEIKIGKSRNMNFLNNFNFILSEATKPATMGAPSPPQKGALNF